MLGTTISGKYRLSRELGKGGMGSVYEAQHVATGKRVALKLMRATDDKSDEAERARLVRFQREALAVGRLETQHVVLVYDAGVDEPTNQPFLAMELLEGEDVSQLIKRLGPLPPQLALAIVAQACAGLQKAHAAGIVHRDIKPSNLFLTKTENGDYVIKVLDFGIAKMSKELGGEMQDGAGTITETGALIGSPHYMSPEQAKSLKTIDHRSDLWSLGVVLHKCLSGRTPFDGHTTLGQVIIAVCSEDPVSVQTHAPWVSPELALVVRRALRRDPGMRYQSATELLEQIRPHLGPTGTRITADMLVPLPPERRAEVATRGSDFPTATPSAMRDIPVYPAGFDGVAAESSGAINVGPMKGPVPANSVTLGASFVTTADAHTPKKRKLWPVLFAALALSGIALGGVGYMRMKNDPGQGGSAASSPSATVTDTAANASSSSSAPAASAASASSTSAPATSGAPVVIRSERLTVGPKGVSVEIDGKPARVEGGVVFVEGPPGSVHRVKLSMAGRDTTAEVVLTEQGARPAKVELASTAVPAATGKSGGAPQAAGPTTPATTKPAPTATAKAGGGFDRSFE